MAPLALRDLAVASAALAASSALGFALEALAARRYFGLHLVPLGPGAGADVALDEPVPKPYGEHGWVPLPLGLLDVALVLASEAAPWGDDSRYKGEGRQLAANCAFSILPAVLAAWLLWMPWSCSPLPCVLAAAVAALGLAGAAFWADALPLLPRARANAASARRATRRALLCALHAPYWALCTAYLCRAPPNGARRFFDPERAGPPHRPPHASDSTAPARAAGCAALLELVRSEPSEAAAWLGHELRAQTPQGAMEPYQLAIQLVVAVVALHTVVETPWI